MNMFFAGIGPYAPKAGEAAKTYRGVVNAGTGASRSFNDVAKALMAVHGQAEIEYIPFPADLEGRYQHFTEADLTGLRELGLRPADDALEEGVAETSALRLRAIGAISYRFYARCCEQGFDGFGQGLAKLAGRQDRAGGFGAGLLHVRGRPR